MADQTTQIEPVPQERRRPHASRNPVVEQLQRELDNRNEEILRLRDLLIRRDAELGAARGRLAIFEQGSQRLSNAAARIPIPGATRLIQGLIRLLQGSRG